MAASSRCLLRVTAFPARGRGCSSCRSDARAVHGCPWPFPARARLRGTSGGGYRAVEDGGRQVGAGAVAGGRGEVGRGAGHNAAGSLGREAATGVLRMT